MNRFMLYSGILYESENIRLVAFELSRINNYTLTGKLVEMIN